MMNIIISVSLAIIGVLVSIVGYFLIKDQRRQEVFNTKITEVIDRLECIANDLCIKYTSHDVELHNFKENHRHLQERFEKFKDSLKIKA